MSGQHKHDDAWRKSSFSGGQTNCVEFRRTPDGVEVRNSKRPDAGKVEERLAALKRAAEGTDNLMPYILDAVRAYATVGEICHALREVFGEYQPV